MNELSISIKDLICYCVASIFKFLDSIQQTLIEMSNKLQSHPLETTELIIWAIGSSIIGLILLGYSIKLRYFDSGILKLVMVVTLGCFIIGVYSVCRLYFQIFL